MGPKFGAPPPPPSPNKKKGPVSKLETPEPVVPPSPQLKTSTEHLTNIVKLLLSKRESQKGEVDTAAINLREELEEMGLSSFMDTDRENDLKNYSKNESSDVQFAAPITPWKVTIVSGRHNIEVLFNEETLKEAIDEIPDATIQKQCIESLEKIKVLLEEEKVAYQEADNTRLIDSGPMIQEVEASFTAFEAKYNIEFLMSLKTEAEAFASEERISAKKDILKIWAQLDKLETETNIPQDRLNELRDKYKALHLRAVGTANRGVVSHE